MFSDKYSENILDLLQNHIVFFILISANVLIIVYCTQNHQDTETQTAQAVQRWWIGLSTYS